MSIWPMITGFTYSRLTIAKSVSHDVAKTIFGKHIVHHLKSCVFCK